MVVFSDILSSRFGRRPDALWLRGWRSLPGPKGWQHALARRVGTCRQPSAKRAHRRRQAQTRAQTESFRKPREPRAARVCSCALRGRRSRSQHWGGAGAGSLAGAGAIRSLLRAANPPPQNGGGRAQHLSGRGTLHTLPHYASRRSSASPHNVRPSPRPGVA